ncbi:hypothetical protein BGX28_009678 [Mortierella sp. GBA30]|nr:hypothetical protein BGX28_009678 [Mortierella sp. GBA30]
MGASYVVFGRSFPSYQLALATYAAVATPVVIMKMRKTEAPNPIQAASPDEEAFIREFVKAAEEEHPSKPAPIHL